MYSIQIFAWCIVAMLVLSAVFVSAVVRPERGVVWMSWEEEDKHDGR